MGIVMTSLKGVSADGLPDRALILSLVLKNQSGSDVVMLRSRVKAMVSSGPHLAQGDFLWMPSAHAYPAIVTASIERVSEVRVPLTSEAITKIEEHRAGKDLQLTFQIDIVAAPVVAVPAAKGTPAQAIGVPFETTLTYNSSSPILIPIEQSKWAQLLRAMEWADLELFEIPKEPLKGDPVLERSLQLLTSAQERFRRGDWRGTLQDSHSALEAAARAASGGTGDLKQGFETLLLRLEDDVKRKKVGDVIKAIRDLCQLGRHEDYPTVDITRRDALAALRITLSVFGLLTGAR